MTALEEYPRRIPALGEFHHTSILGVQRLTVLHKLASSSKLGTNPCRSKGPSGSGSGTGTGSSHVFMAPSRGTLITTSGIITCSTAIIGIRAVGGRGRGSTAVMVVPTAPIMVPAVPVTAPVAVAVAVIVLRVFNAQRGETLVDVIRDTLASLLRAVGTTGRSVIALVSTFVRVCTTSRRGPSTSTTSTRTGLGPVMIIRLLPRRSDQSRRRKFLPPVMALRATAPMTMAAITRPWSRSRPWPVHEMVRSKTRQRRLDDMSLLVLAGVLVNKSIRTTGRYRGSEDAFSLFTFPFTWFVADAERLDGTGCNGCTDGLLHFVLALAAGTLLASAGAAARSAARWRRRNRVRLAMPMRATTVIVVSIL